MKIVEINCGSEAASHLEPYSPQTSHNFEIPRQIGRLIAGWGNPEFVPALEASHMRDDDYVVGLLYKNVARAYPLWITDNYHAINDTIAGEPILFATCDRCQSGSAFVSIVESQPLKFSAVGMYNAALTLINREGLLDRGNIWLHYEGVAIYGKLAGTFLPQIPTFHTIWKDWRLAHPETDVMAVPKDRHHRDARHGHGREEYFSRPGMDSFLAKTIRGELDYYRYPENEMVLGINLDRGVKAYPLKEVKMSGSVVEDDFGEQQIAIFAGPHPEQFTMAAYSRIVDRQILSFRLQGDYYVDRQTGSHWTIEGLAVRGPLASKQLTPLRWQFVRWHAWFYPHRNTELYHHQGDLPIYPDVCENLDISSFLPVLEGLSKLERQIVVEGTIINLRLPHEAVQGVSLRVGTDKLNLYRFETQEAAEDYVAFFGAWFCMPIDTKLGRKFSCRHGTFVLESDPEIQYADPCQRVRLPDSQIKWADLVTDADLIRHWSAGISEGTISGDRSFSRLFEHLKKAGYDVVEVAFLPHSQLRVGTHNAVAATINADRFAVYKCESAASVDRVVSEFPSAFKVGHWVFRSIPVAMYRDTYYQIGQLPDKEIPWSKLIGHQRFLTTIEKFNSNNDC